MWSLKPTTQSTENKLIRFLWWHLQLCIWSTIKITTSPPHKPIYMEKNYSQTPSNLIKHPWKKYYKKMNHSRNTNVIAKVIKCFDRQLCVGILRKWLKKQIWCKSLLAQNGRATVCDIKYFMLIELHSLYIVHIHTSFRINCISS